MQIKKLYNNFFARFITISALLILLWKNISVIYLNILVPFSNMIFNIFNPKVDLNIVDSILKLQYPDLTFQFLQFSVNDFDQIFLNIVIFYSLIISSYNIDISKRLKYSFVGTFVLMTIHSFVLMMYSYSTIWDYANSLPVENESNLQVAVEKYFSTDMTSMFEVLLFNWNSWGWDVLPILLWLPLGIHQFKSLLDKSILKKSFVLKTATK